MKIKKPLLCCLYCEVVLNIDRSDRKKVKIKGQWHRPLKKQFCNEYCIKGYYAYLAVIKRWRNVPEIKEVIDYQLLQQISRNPVKPMRKELADFILKRNRMLAQQQTNKEHRR